MLIGGDDMCNDVITLNTCFSMFVYIRARSRLLIGGNLTTQSTRSHRELEVEFKFQRRSRTLSFLSCAVARAPRRACSQAKVNRKTQILLPEYCSFPISAYMTVNRSNVRFVIGCSSP